MKQTNASILNSSFKNRCKLLTIGCLLFFTVFFFLQNASFHAYAAEKEPKVYTIRGTLYDEDGNILIVVGKEFERGCGPTSYDNIVSTNWSISNRNILNFAGTTVNNCILRAVSPGVCTVTAVVQSSYTRYDSLSHSLVTVYGTDENVHKIRVVQPVTSITLNRTQASLALNETMKLTYTTIPSDIYSQAVSPIGYRSSNPSVATVDAAGNVTAKANGTAVITASYAEGNVSAQCTITVGKQPASAQKPSKNQTEQPKATAIQLNFRKLTLEKGKKRSLTYTLTPATGEKVTFKSSNPKVVRVNAKGRVTAIKAGKATITARVSSKVKATCKITVPKRPTSIRLNKSRLTLQLGKSYKLTCKCIPAGSKAKISWKSNKPKIAAVNAKGKITGKKTGTATITARSQNGKKATCKVTVKAPKVKSIKVSPKSVTLKQGQQQKITYTLKPQGAMAKVTFKSNKPKVATVNAKGMITAKSGGTATIRVKVSSKIQASCKVTVLKSPDAIQLNTNSMTLQKGASGKLTYRLSPSGSYAEVTFKSSSNAVRVQADGTVTAAAVGKATVTAETSNGKKAACIVTVTPPDPTGIQLRQTSLTLEAGASSRLTYAFTPGDASGTVTFSSSDAAVATVDASGTVTAKAAGSATITARISSGASATCKVTVPAHAKKISIYMGNKHLFFVSAGENLSLSYLVTPANHVDTVSWHSSDPSIATVDGTGVIHGNREGLVTITGEVNGHTASCQVQVIQGDWLDVSRGTIIINGNGKAQQNREGTSRYDIYSYDLQEGITLVQSNPDTSFRISVDSCDDGQKGPDIRVRLHGINIGWKQMSIRSRDNVILELAAGTESYCNKLDYRNMDEESGSSQESSLLITGTGKLTVNSFEGPAIAVNRNLIIESGQITVSTADGESPVIGIKPSLSPYDGCENIQIQSGAQVTALGGCMAVGTSQNGPAENIQIAQGSLTYDPNGGI